MRQLLQAFFPSIGNDISKITIQKKNTVSVFRRKIIKKKKRLFRCFGVSFRCFGVSVFRFSVSWFTDECPFRYVIGWSTCGITQFSEESGAEKSAMMDCKEVKFMKKVIFFPSF